jgi:hypothetical protein
MEKRGVASGEQGWKGEGLRQKKGSEERACGADSAAPQGGSPGGPAGLSPLDQP